MQTTVFPSSKTAKTIVGKEYPSSKQVDLVSLFEPFYKEDFRIKKLNIINNGLKTKLQAILTKKS